MIYFDNAATTFPKPPEVVRAISACLRERGGNPGRSGHPLALAAAEAVFDVRCRVSSFFGGTKPENVVFTKNTTEALNLAVAGIARRGAHLLISDLEHNSVRRTVIALCERVGMTFDTVGALCDDDTLLSRIESAIRPDTIAVVMTHASNVCPRVLPIRRIGALCRAHRLLYLVDAAQSAGIVDLDVGRDGISILCAPGHKGLYGPQGSGFALFADDFDFTAFAPSQFGGNGKNSADADMGREPPESYEAGTVAVPNIVGLGAGLSFVEKRGRQAIERHEQTLYRALRDRLLPMPRVRLYLPEIPEGSLLLLGFDGVSPTEIAARLGDYGVCTRAGLHCAPTAHAALGTGGDALRVSFSAFNTRAEVDRFADLLGQMLSS